MVGLTSAAGVVGFLFEPDHELQIFALRKLNEEINSLWTEVAGSVGQIEALYEDPYFPERELAALVAAKVYYNLQEYSESMVFALGAGKLFDLDHEGEFEDTIISKCIDAYIAFSDPAPPSNLGNLLQPRRLLLTTAFSLPSNGASSTSASLASPTTPFSQSTLPSKSLLSRTEGITSMVPSLQGGGNPGILLAPGASQSGVHRHLNAIINQLFERCYHAGRYRQVVGIAVEARKLDVVRWTILRAIEDEKRENNRETGKIGRGEELMEYVLEICMDIVQENGLRTEVQTPLSGNLIIANNYHTESASPTCP